MEGLHEFRKQFIPTICKWLVTKLQFDTFLQREIKVLKGKLPSYMALTGISSTENYTLIADGYDTKLTAFEVPNSCFDFKF
jgi:hypothetical protein